MTKPPESAHVNRLIKLLMMLPAPGAEEYPYFWDMVAQEHRVSRGYVAQKISAHLKLLLDGNEGGADHGKQLAHYALFFFGKASEELTTARAATTTSTSVMPPPRAPARPGPPRAPGRRRRPRPGPAPRASAATPVPTRARSGTPCR